MKKISLCLIGLLLSVACIAEGWNEKVYKQIESRIVAPTFQDKVYNITKYGASEKATAAKNQKAINKAIADC